MTPPLSLSSTLTVAAVAAPSDAAPPPLRTIGVPSVTVAERLPSRIVLPGGVSTRVLLVIVAVNDTLPAGGVMPAAPGPLSDHGTLTLPTLPPLRVTVSVTGVPSTAL